MVPWYLLAHHALVHASSLKRALKMRLVLIAGVIVSIASLTHAGSYASNELGIVIPTYEYHFDRLHRLLNSFTEFVTDVEDLAFLIVTSRKTDKANLKVRLHEQTKGVKGQIQYLVEDIHIILDHFNVTFRPPGFFYGGYGVDENKWTNRFNLQTVKKLYGLRFLSKKWMLWGDSELQVFKELSFRKHVFEPYFRDPYIFYSHVTRVDGQIVTFGPDFLRTIQPSLNVLLGSKEPWGHDWPRFVNFMGYQGWMIDNAVIHELFAIIEARSGKSLMETIGLPKEDWHFEPQIIYNFLWAHQRRFRRYRFVSFEDVMPLYLREKTAAYMNQHYINAYPNGTMLYNLPLFWLRLALSNKSFLC